MSDAAPPGYPQALGTFLQSNWCRKGRLVAWWRNPGGDVCVLISLDGTSTPSFELSIVPESFATWGHALQGYTLEAGDVEKALAGGNGFYGANWTEGDPAPTIIAAFLARERAKKPAERLPNGTTLFLLDAAPFEQSYLYHPALVSAAQWQSLVVKATEDALDLVEDLPRGDAPLALPPQAGAVLWDGCRVDCVATTFTVKQTPSFFSDLESAPPPWQMLSAEAMPAWNLFVSLGGVTAADPASLPWWLHGAAQAMQAFTGILSPSESQRIATHQGALLTLFMGSPLQQPGSDVLAHITHAANKGAYCVAWEMP